MQPLLVDSIQIYAAQRYSFVLNANQQVDNYCACYLLCDRSLYVANLLVLGIRAFPNSSSDNPEALTFDNGLNSAILRYKGAKIAEPTTPNKPSVLPLVETNLHPFPPSPPPATADETIPLQISLVRFFRLL